MVVSTQAGLLRYDLADDVEVVGRCGQVPLVRFVGKHGRYLNCMGEKVTAAQVSAAMGAAAAAVGEHPVGFCVRIRLDEVPAYVVALEGVQDVGAMTAAFDEALSVSNVEYASKRESGRLASPEPLLLPAGALARYREGRARDGAPEGQVKDPIIAVDEETWRRVVAP